MPCKVVPVDGGHAIICIRGKRFKPCAYCAALHEVLCDGPGATKGSTCDLPMCREHATHVEGRNLDYCRKHAALGHQQIIFGEENAE